MKTRKPLVRHTRLRSVSAKKEPARPWRMCRTCHRHGTSRFGACPRVNHPLGQRGACGQCGKVRPLVECHGYDFWKSAPGPTRRAWINRTTKKARKPRKPLAKVGKQKAKRQARNAEYYRSAEWRAKRKAVFARDGYQCTETVPSETNTGTHIVWSHQVSRLVVAIRCPNRGEIVNGKQTARGLVCEERSYGHRGNPDRIDTCTTRCKDCDRRRTPLERANHSHGFNNRQSYLSGSTTE